jgi:hypothetical protein
VAENGVVAERVAAAAKVVGKAVVAILIGQVGPVACQVVIEETIHPVRSNKS